MDVDGKMLNVHALSKEGLEDLRGGAMDKKVTETVE